MEFYNKCLVKTPLIIRFINCDLNFGYNTKFEYKYRDDNVILYRKNITLTLTKDEFNKYFKKID